VAIQRRYGASSVGARIRNQPSRPYLAAVGLAALALAGAGCGGDDEKSTATSPSTDAQTESAETEIPQTQTEATETTDAKEFEDKADTSGKGTGGAKSPEDQPGGAGDEVPASSQALLTGKGGKIAPDVVSVPPFLAISVELRSADGATYALQSGRKRLQVGADVKSRTTTFAGLRPGKALVLTGPQGKVTVVADAEPGP
jgi:hypothetical protein